MAIALEPDELEIVERIASSPPRSTRRQRAQAILLLNRGEDTARVAERVGIPKPEVEALERKFRVHRVNLFRKPQGYVWVRKAEGIRGIEKTEGVCGGSARIAGTRIPVWVLVALRGQGASEAEVLLDYPGLTAEDLVNAWAYAAAHAEEIAAEVHENEVL